MAKIVHNIYTVSAYYKPPKNKIEREYILHDYESLPDEFKEWVLETSIRMMDNPTRAESLFEDYLKSKSVVYEKQVFFRINGKSYFLDFYIPSKRLAIEIDGGYHKVQKCYDMKRNKDFQRIGINTMRLANKVAFAKDIDKAIANRKRQPKKKLSPQNRRGKTR